jgi:predicted ATPase/class 3 adenylate cyclase
VAGAPSGTITFLFTDIEGSTRRWEQLPDVMQGELAEHDRILKVAIARHDGYMFSPGGDGFGVAFSGAHAALTCACEVQRELSAASLPPVRMALHTGEAEERDGNYFGSAVNRAARLGAVGHGGQVLLSSATRELVVNAFELRDLGEHRLKDLAQPEHVYQLVADGLGTDFPSLRSLDLRTTNLPAQLSTFVGRADDLEAVAELVAAHRVVTLTGIGGVGKTRLALQVAADLLDRYAHGVWFVELAPIDAPQLVNTVARALDVDVQSGESIEDSLVDTVRAKQLLLVLDNCEHVIREARRVTDLLLREAAGVSVLLTSREGLRVPGEYLYAVPSLDDDSARRLFVERASEGDASFTLDAASDRALGDLCDRLDGVPLAIELAAARVRMFSVAELSQRVEQRFRLLTGGRGDVERHQTLRAAIDWSYDLLDPAERLGLARCSVFAGGATLDAVEAVVADDDLPSDAIVDVLAGLVDKSLVLVDRSRPETRYEMQETIRQYAQEKLAGSGEADDVRNRHARWYADFARRAGRGLYSSDEREWNRRLQPEMDNLQVAVGWAAATGQTDVAMRIGSSFPRGVISRPLLGTGQLAEAAMRVDGADAHPDRARVLAEMGWVAVSRGDPEGARALLDRSVEAQHAGARFAAATFMYLMSLAGTEALDTREDARVGLALAEASGDAVAANGLRSAYAAILAVHDAESDEALRLAERALDEARAFRQPTLEIAALYAVAMALVRADPERAIASLRNAAELIREVGNEAEELPVLSLLAFLEARHGDQRRALEALRDQMRVTVRSTGTNFIAGLRRATPVLNRAGRADLVARAHGVDRMLVRGRSVPDPMSSVYDEEVRNARAALGDERFEALCAEGEASAPEDLYPMMLAEVEVLLAEMPEPS